ncbi:MAG: glycoside hydrolase family 2 TIM barrel-domain containing protein [Pseudomonadota bacterium]
MRILTSTAIALLFIPGLLPAQPVDAELIEDTRPALDRAAMRELRPAGVPVMENVLARGGRELSGEWRYIVDPMRAGLRRGNSRRDFFNDRKVDPRGELIEYDWDVSPKIQVPGDWNSQVEELRWYDDMVWYRLSFDAEAAEGERRFLHFEAVNYRSWVFLNGAELGNHEGGFTPFEFEVTQHLEEGRNSLVVGVDARHGAQSVPGDYFDWKNYGGITRPVHLVSTPATYVRDYRLEYDAAAERVLATVLLDGPDAANTEVTVSLADRTTSARTDRSGVAALELPADGMGLWSPEDPTLWPLRVAAGEDTLEDRFGLRSIERRGAKLYLNGEALFLRGISVHEEPLGEQGSRWMDDTAVNDLLDHVEALNANFVRLAHYPHNERMLRLAEERGLLVWSEIPVYWEVIDYSSAATLALARRMQAVMIHRDFNRANIVVWSVANETPITAPRNAFLGVLIDDARALGGKRLISAALNKNRVEGNRITIDDPLGRELDLIAVNEYEGWYGPRKLHEIGEVQWSSVYDKPLMFSEFGAGALAGYRDEKEIRWTEDFQAAFYAESLDMLSRAPNLTGLSPWLLKDFRSPRRWHGRYQDFWNRKGVISETGERKLAFDVLADWYADRAARDAAER